MTNKASNWAYNDAKKTYENGKAYYNYKMQQAEAAQTDRKRAEAAFKGYTHKGTFGTSTIEKMHLHSAEKQYRDNGYDVLKHVVTLSNGKTGIRLYVKKLPQRAQKKITARKAPARITGKGKAKVSRSKSTTKAKKTIPKYLTVANKKYEKAGTFGGYQDSAKAFANDLKRKGFAVRVKKLIVNSEPVFTVYTRNPSRRKA